jgi:hypothetical protein
MELLTGKKIFYLMSWKTYEPSAIKITIKHDAIENNSANFLITSAILIIYY